MRMFRLLVLAFVVVACAPTRAWAQGALSPPPPAPPMDDSPRIPVGDSPSLGPASALVTVVIFGTPRDPFSASTRPTLQALRAHFGDDVRIVWKAHPSIASSPDARLAVEGALAAHAQHHFWEMLSRLYDEPGLVTVATVERIAGELHLDVARLRADMAAHTHAAAIDADVHLGASLHLGDYAPTFVINGTVIPGAHPEDRLTPVIDAALAVARRAAPRTLAYRSAVDHPIADPEGFPEPPDGFSRVRDTSVLYRVPLTGAPVAGPPDALVTVVAFEDFQCPVCVRSQPVIEAMQQRYGNDVRFVWRNLPLWIHLDAIPAAEGAMEAYAQGGDAAFWRYHHAVFAHARDPAYVTRPNLERYAQDAGLDMARFRAALDHRTRLARVREDVQMATHLGVGGTPGFLVNGHVLTGFQTPDAFAAAIDSALAEARRRVAAGVARASLYDTLTADAATGEVFLRAGPDGSEPRYPIASRAGAPARGPAHALVELILFASMEGTASAQTTATVEAIARAHPRQVHVEYRNFFVDGIHRFARMGAEATLEAYAQQGLEGFTRYRDTLYANQTALTRADLERYAAAQHLDTARFRASLDGHTHAPELGVDQDAARAYGFPFEPPVLFVNGRRLGAGTPTLQIERAVTAALAEHGGVAP